MNENPLFVTSSSGSGKTLFNKHHVRIFRNLIYAPFNHPQFDPWKHQLDVYVPWDHEGSHKTYPVIVYIHGGAWLFGDRSQSKPRDIGKCLARCGYVVCVISYRLSHISRNDIGEIGAILSFILVMMMLAKKDLEKRVWLLIGVLIVLIFLYAELQVGPNRNMHPCHVEDCALAVKWTVDHIHNYRGRNREIFLMGHSAGGHLATLLASHPTFLPSTGVCIQNHIKGVIAISGVYSDERLADSTIGLKVGRSIFGRSRRRWRDAFAVRHVRPGQPPVLLLNGEFECGLKIHAYDYYWALKDAGVYVEQLSFRNLNHFNIVAFWTSDHQRIPFKIDEFIQKCLTFSILVLVR